MRLELADEGRYAHSLWAVELVVGKVQDAIRAGHVDLAHVDIAVEHSEGVESRWRNAENRQRRESAG